MTVSRFSKVLLGQIFQGCRLLAVANFEDNLRQRGPKLVLAIWVFSAEQLRGLRLEEHPPRANGGDFRGEGCDGRLLLVAGQEVELDSKIAIHFANKRSMQWRLHQP